MTRELRNTVFMWSVFLIILLIMSFQLMANSTTDMNAVKQIVNEQCVKSIHNQWCIFENNRNGTEYIKKVENKKVEYEILDNKCSLTLLIWYVIYVILVVVKFGFATYAYCRRSNIHY